jgi:NADH:ubiquinone oxidoreductase subunit 4 (subunit M)
VPLLILIVAIGFYPNFVFEMSDGGVQQALQGVVELASGG